MKKVFASMLVATMLLSINVPISAQTSVWKEFYVVLDGSDQNPGNKDAPFKTIQAAKNAVREVNKEMKDSYSNILSTYRLQYAIVEEIVDGRIKFLCKDGAYETLELGKFAGKIIAVEDGKFTVYPMYSAGVCISQGDRLVVYSNAGYHKSIVVYK